MYQQNQNANPFRNESARNYQNNFSGAVAGANYPNMVRFQNPMIPNRNFQNIPGGQSSLSSGFMRHNQISQNQLPPLSLGPLSFETNNLYNENISNQNTPPRRIAPQSHNVTSTIVQPVESTSNNCGNNFRNNDNTYFTDSFENTPQPGVFMHCASPAVLIPQNNKNFSAQIAKSQNRFVAGGSNIEKAETSSVVSNDETTRARTWTTMNRNENEKIRIFTGTAEKVIKWHKTYKDYFCFYEVIASIVSIQEGTVRLQKIMLLRDNKGPVIQVIHYINDHINIENFVVGQMLRCVGHMVGPNILHGLSIREATPDEITTLRRMCYIGEHAISKDRKS